MRNVEICSFGNILHAFLSGVSETLLSDKMLELNSLKRPETVKVSILVGLHCS